MGERISVEVSTVDGVTVVVLVGDLDAASAPVLEHEMGQLDGQLVLVDCAGVTFIDSSGLSAILRQQLRLEMKGGRLRLRAPSAAVRHVLSLTGMRGLEQR
jgi:anti-anti-sigma factor